MLLFAVYVETNQLIPVVISAESISGPTTKAKYVRDATKNDSDLPDYAGFDFGDSIDRFFTGKKDLLEKGRAFLEEYGK